jgi:hypothetical protein
VDPLVGKYFSQEYIRKNLLKQDDQEIIRLNAEMEQERAVEQERMMQQQMMQQQMAMAQQQQGMQANA